MMKHCLKWLLQLVLVLGFSSAQAGAYTDFFRAVSVDNASTVTELLQRGFDPNSRDERGQTGLYLALRDGADKCAQALIAHPQLAPDLLNAAGESALMMAALRGRTDWMQKLLDRGAAVEQGGWTALHYAASGPEPKAVALLLARGAKTDARSPNGSTPLMMAARYGAEPSVDLLLAAGADLGLRNQLDLSAIDFARQADRETLAKRLAALAR
jgi:ankyrin repeat protein